MTEIATFAAGCFWGVENKFMKINGVLSTRVGYIGGKKEQPTYHQVCLGNTGHAEAVELQYNPDLISYSTLLKTFFQIHDPTQLNRQGPDIGSQYRSAIFYHNEDQKMSASKFIKDLNTQKIFTNEIVTSLEQAATFWEAEEYHQKYILKNGGACSI